MSLKVITSICILAPLLGCLMAGLAGSKIGRRGAHTITILLMLVSLASAMVIFQQVIFHQARFDGVLYHWGISGRFQFNIGYLIDPLSAIMMLVVTFVSLLVHIYSIGYMSDDPGYQRFFSYVSLFTFAMLLLVSANNFLQLFIGWEGVGLVSYLLIGFWFYKESAAEGSLKAFMVNRVGDFGFLLGIAAVLAYFGSLDYHSVFANAQREIGVNMRIMPGVEWPVITVTCLLLFVGAMGKSAQVPLHVWLPESMEGPTPISALIHAATMVTAGVYMVARMSPLFELSATALSVVVVVGATGALFLGLLAFVENDIKRVIAFSTMSQLGYMMAADGVSAYAAGIFHLVTHACFKALLFLAAGSVIIAMHHEQDLRKMGNLKKYLPVTCVTFLVGALALSAIPPFAGYFSKDSIIEAVHQSTLPVAHYAYICLLLGSFVTAYYIFRAYFMAFHTQERMSEKLQQQLSETPWSMRFALIALAIPSVVLGAILIKPILYQVPGLLGNSIKVSNQYDVLAQLRGEFHGAWSMVLHAYHSLAFWFALSGIVAAYLMVVVVPSVPDVMARLLPRIRRILVGQYGFDAFNNLFFVRGTRAISSFFYRYTDMKIIDGFMVNGSGRTVTRLAKLIRRLQSGYLYHYTLLMILGLLLLLVWFILV